MSQSLRIFFLRHLFDIYYYIDNVEKYIMKIGILKIKNRSKKKPQKLDVYIIHYLKGKPKKNRLKGMYLFEHPRTAFQKNHNKDTNYEIEQILSKARKEQRLGYYDIEDYTKEAISVISYCEEVFIPKKSKKYCFDFYQ